MGARPLASPAAERPARSPESVRTDGRPQLRVIEGGRDRLERRRATARAIGMALVSLLLVVAVWAAYTIAGATIGERTVEAGATVVVEPGETLWDVAVTHAPEGTDPRSYLEDLRHLNGGSSVDAWSVVQLPAG